MQELPYDVWQQIGQHLPYNSLKQNMSLNRAFLHCLLMKSRYEVVVISHRNAKDCMQTLGQMQEPIRGAHVEDLTLEIHPRAIPALGLQFDAFLNKTLQALDAMHNLSALHTISQPYSDNLYGSRHPSKDNVDDDNGQLRAFFSSMWKKFGVIYLRELTLQGTPSHLQLVLHELSLPALKKLDIILFSKKKCCLNAHETSYHLLVPFINGLAEHLEHLTTDPPVYTNDMIGLVSPHLNLNLKYLNLQL